MWPCLLLKYCACNGVVSCQSTAPATGLSFWNIGLAALRDLLIRPKATGADHKKFCPTLKMGRGDLNIRQILILDLQLQVWKRKHRRFSFTGGKAPPAVAKSTPKAVKLRCAFSHSAKRKVDELVWKFDTLCETTLWVRVKRHAIHHCVQTMHRGYVEGYCKKSWKIGREHSTYCGRNLVCDHPVS